MKTLKTWKIVFIVMGVAGIVLLIVNKMTPPESTSVEMIMRRPVYIVVSLVFFVAAVIMDIIKAALNEEKKK